MNKSQLNGKVIVFFKKIHLLPNHGPDVWSFYLKNWLDLFIIANLAFLAIDIFVAHSVNQFHNPAEWIPFAFSIAAPIFLLIEYFYNINRQQNTLSIFSYSLGGISIAIGLAGLFFHLDSQFFQQQTLKSIVYTAPFVAPLAYAGLGFLLWMNRLIPSTQPSWSRWVVILSWFGLLGNFVLVLCDHAQNGFFVIGEWIPVGMSAITVSMLGFVCILRNPPQKFLHVCQAFLVLQAVIGIIGFFWHTHANLPQVGAISFDDFVYGAPIFAPLLFPNLALLAGLGLVRRPVS